jgi:hypothetical protein
MTPQSTNHFKKGKSDFSNFFCSTLHLKVKFFPNASVHLSSCNRINKNTINLPSKIYETLFFFQKINKMKDMKIKSVSIFSKRGKENHLILEGFVSMLFVIVTVMRKLQQKKVSIFYG